MCQIHLIEPKPRKDEVKKENVLCDAHHLLEVNNGIILNLNHETFFRKGTVLKKSTAFVIRNRHKIFCLPKFLKISKSYLEVL